MTSDERLVRDCLAGDAAAWEAFAGRFGPFLEERLARVAAWRKIPLRPEDLEDIVSKTWEDLLRDDRRLLRLYRPEASLERWLFTLAVHRLFSWVRERKQEERLLDGARGALPAGEIESLLPPEAAARAENATRLSEAVGRLPSRERFALSVFYWSGWSHQRIGQVLRIPAGNVGSVLRSARERLRDLLRHPENFLI